MVRFSKQPVRKRSFLRFLRSRYVFLKVTLLHGCLSCFLNCANNTKSRNASHIPWDKTQMLKKFPSNKINGTKNALFFLSRAPAHHSFTFNLRLLYELKHKVRLSKTVCGIFHFRFSFVFIKIYIFVQQNHGLFDTFKRRNSFQN